MTDQQGKDRAYWIDEIAFLEARLNGSQGDIDSEDRAACEEALKGSESELGCLSVNPALTEARATTRV